MPFLSKNGVSDQAFFQLTSTQWKVLESCDDSESTGQFAACVCSDWTNKTVQPMHVDKALQELINKPARNSAGATMAPSQPSSQPRATVNVENKGSGASTSSAMSAPPDPSSDVSKETSSDKRTRESPDTTGKPGGKSLKTSGEPTSSQNAASGQGAQADDMSVDHTTEKDDSTKQRTTTRRLANHAPEARVAN